MHSKYPACTVISSKCCYIYIQMDIVFLGYVCVCVCGYLGTVVLWSSL